MHWNRADTIYYSNARNLHFKFVSVAWRYELVVQTRQMCFVTADEPGDKIIKRSWCKILTVKGTKHITKIFKYFAEVANLKKITCKYASFRPRKRLSKTVLFPFLHVFFSAFEMFILCRYSVCSLTKFYLL